MKVTKDKPLRVLSLGAGVQSSTLALMSIEGELPAPDVAIFADTGAEPHAVYEWLDELEKLMSWPLVRVMQDDGLLENIRNKMKAGRFVSAPFFTESDGGGGMLRRQCTREFKVEPITREIRKQVGAEKGQKIAHLGVLVHQSIGISLDEVVRMKTSHQKWIEHHWPLVDLRMSRHDCKQWLARKGYEVPARSACTFCPYHDNAEWRAMKENDPASWNQAVEIDTMIRDGVRATSEAIYLHRSLRPLWEVDLSTDEEKGQGELFNNECEGMCGV